MDVLTEILSRMGEDDTPFEFEFFIGRKNKKFDDIIRGIGPSSNNLDFLDFLQSDQCKQILVNNKLNIHIETGNFQAIAALNIHLGGDRDISKKA